MSKKCIKCGEILPDDASFCPHCTTVQTEKKEIKTPRKWRKKAVIGVAVLAVAAVIGIAFSIYHRPKTYEGGAQITYTDKGKSYKVLLSFSEEGGMTGHAQGERTDTLSEGMNSALPCQLYVLNKDTGELAGEEFSKEVESCKVDTNPSEGSQKMEYVEPVYNESFPNAAYVSDINYVSDSGTNDIQWTLTMKNGDTIFLSTRLTIEKQPAVSYYAEDTQILGTTGFAAPEQYGLSQSDGRADIYALGVLLNIMLTGEHPSRKLAGGRMGRIVQRCTMVNPAKRYKNILHLMEVL